MRTLLTVLSALVAVALSAPEPCCLPRKWEGFISSTGSTHVNGSSRFNSFESHGQAAFDADRGRTALDLQVGTRNFHIRIIDDYRRGRRYYITRDEQNCTMAEMFESVFHVCIPDSATLQSSTKFGPPGHTVDVDRWTTDIDGMTYTGQVTRDKCYPVSLSYHGLYNGIYTDVNRYVYNVTEGIADARKMFIPRSCRRPTPKCCVPGQFSATISNIGDTFSRLKLQNTYTHEAGKIYFDNTNQMLAMHLYGDDPANPTKVIEDFKAKIAYHVAPNGSCSIKELSMPDLHECVSESANNRYHATYYLGGPFRQLKVQVWNHNNMRLEFTDDDCFPVSQTMKTESADSDKNDFTRYFVNLKMGLNDTSVFNIPSSCPRMPKVIFIDGKPKPCCNPEKWEGWVIGLGATNQSRRTGDFASFQYEGRFSYDNTMLKAAYSSKGFRAVLDYRRGVAYRMTNDDANCTSVQVFRPTRACIRDDATYVGATAFGPPGDQFVVDTWRSKDSYGMTYVDIVTRDQCLPVGYERSGIFAEETSDRMSNLVNMTIGIANSSVFSIPKICYAPPTPCCFPSPFTSDFADIGDNFNKVNRQNSIVDIKGKFYFDSTSQVITSDVYTGAGGSLNRRITNYAQQKSYVIENGNCTVTSINQTMLTCIPANARHRGNRYFGRPENQYSFDRWHFTVAGVSTTVLTQQGTCYPLMDTFQLESKKVTSETELYFLNISKGVNDTSVFIEPNNCVPAAAG